MHYIICYWSDLSAAMMLRSKSFDLADTTTLPKNNLLPAMSNEKEQRKSSLGSRLKKESSANNGGMRIMASAEDLIEESKALLHRHSSDLVFETEDIILDSGRSKKREKRPSEAGNVVSRKTSIQPISILGTKHIKDGLPIIKEMKKKKALRFNMDKNETFEIVQPELTSSSLTEESSSESEDEFSCTKDTNNNKTTPKRVMFANVMDAGDLVASDDVIEKNEDLKEEEVKQNGFSADEKDNLKDEIAELAAEKRDLLSELKTLRKRHDKEMAKLREEYQLRREDYYTELDEVQYEINEKRNELHSKSSLSSSNSLTRGNENENLTPLRDRVDNEKKKLEAQESDVKKRQAEVLEQEQELKEYQRYLDRRHKSLNEKEEDLCLLQDELEELDDILKAKRKELGAKKEQLEIQPCTHDEKQIEKTRNDLHESLKRESEIRDRLHSTKEENEKHLEKLNELDEENHRLHSKIKHLETQLTINLKSSMNCCLPDKRNSLRARSSTIPVDEKTGELKSPTTSPRGGVPQSPTRSLPLTNGSPSHKITEPKTRDENSNVLIGDPSDDEIRTDSKSVQSKTCALM
eukprot:TCONS_00004497-protein